MAFVRLKATENYPTGSPGADAVLRRLATKFKRQVFSEKILLELSDRRYFVKPSKRRRTFRPKLKDAIKR